MKHFHARRRNGSSARSAMFIAQHADEWAKLRRSGMCGFNRDMLPRWGLEWFWDGDGYIHCAPLGQRVIRCALGEILASLAKMEAGVKHEMNELEGMLR